jgi:predicted nucleic acid-binding protein
VSPRGIIDASITLAWGFPDEISPEADYVLTAVRNGGAIVPAIWPLEVANAVLVAERRSRLSRADGAAFLARLQRLPIQIDAGSEDLFPQTVFTLAREHALSYYDATYLELAMRMGLPLATFDTALLRAMAASGVVTFTSAA